MDDYIAVGTILPEQSTFLRVAVEKRRNVLVPGGTSTSKIGAETIP